MKRCFSEILNYLGVLVNSAYVKASFWSVLRPPQPPWFLHPCLELGSLAWPPFSPVTPPLPPPLQLLMKSGQKHVNCQHFILATEPISTLVEKKHLKGKGLSNHIRWLRILTFMKANLINTMSECEGVSAFVRCNLFFMQKFKDE